ncbi:MAG: ComF family protein [Rhodobacteraceae bacterium]|nr:ComF family protein [Paracoccaceae bacterium]
MLLRSVLQVVYPPRCIGCGAQVESDFGLCSACWRDTPFIAGTVCECCGVPLPGDADGYRIECDDCMATPRPWVDGRSVMLYAGQARSLVLALKHGDRPEIAHAVAPWMARVAAPLLREDMVVIPVPLHWSRLWQRRYNQAALLGQALANQAGLQHCPDALIRPRRTTPQDGKSPQARFESISGAIRFNPKQTGTFKDRPVLLVDDVMTSGATFAECAQVCRDGGSGDVFVLALARAVRED